MKKGGMVLNYSVKNHKHKFKYRGLRSYHIIEITSQGIVKIDTLDEVETEGYFNGTMQKCYYGPEHASLDPQAQEQGRETKSRE